MLLIRPVILYKSKTLPLRKIDEKKFIVFERKVLWRIYAPDNDNTTE